MFRSVIFVKLTLCIFLTTYPEISSAYSFSTSKSEDSIALNYWGATINQIQQAPCRQTFSSSHEIESYLKELSRPPFVSSEKINGVHFQNESLPLLNEFKKLTTRYNLFGEANSQLNIQDEYSINPKCTKVVCALKIIFGDVLGPRLLYLVQKYGLNGSQLSFDNTAKLMDDETERFMSAVQDFPQLTFPLDKNKQFSKFKRGHILSLSSSDVIANAKIAFYDKWLTVGSDELMEYIVVHELAHYISFKLDLSDSPYWASFSGWKGSGEKWTYTKNNSFVSNYAKKNPTEDFAESVATYRYNPGQLQKASPSKYQFIKEVVFHGIEYINEDTCRFENSYLNIAKNNLSQKISPLNIESSYKNDDKLAEIMKPCKDETVDFIFKNNEASIDAFNKCISSSVTANLIREFLNGRSFVSLNYPEFIMKKLRLFPGHIPPLEIPKMNQIQLSSQKFIINLLVNAFFKWDKDSSFLYPSSDAQSLCKDLAKNGEISLNKLNDIFEDRRFTYQHSQQIRNLIREVCMKAQPRSPRPMSRDEIAKALKNLHISYKSQ